MSPFLLWRIFTLKVELTDYDRVLDKFLILYEAGVLKPIPAVQYFDAPSAPAAFRFLQRGDHIGKAVITFSPAQKIQSIPGLGRVKFDPRASYILTGGLGGLGRSTATWMVERGARSLAFLSRSAWSADNAVFVRELEAMGCEVTVVSGFVERMEDVEAVVKACPYPIKGVFHLAMVLEVSILKRPCSCWVPTNTARTPSSST